MSADTFLMVQPQVSQLDLQFAGPLDKNTVVNTLSDLTTLKFNYLHRRVWVKSEECEYYLVYSGPNMGNSITHWKQVTGKVSIEEYSPNKSYVNGDVVMVKMSGKLYRAIDNVPEGSSYNPIKNPRIWQPIVGDVETQMFEFDNQSEITITVDQQNPMFRVYQVTEESGQSLTFEIDCKITEILDQQDSDDVLGFDIEDDDILSELALNKLFKFEFFEKDEPVQISGFIIMK